jgi:hypothetical protein
MAHRSPEQKRRMVAIDGAMALMAILLVVQMWLLSATLEQYLSGHHKVALPAALVAGVLFGGCVALYRFVVRVDKKGT